MKIISVLVAAVLALCHLNVVESGHGHNSEAEEAILRKLYESTGGDNWRNNRGWADDDEYCNWYGVTCEDGNVTWIWLHGNHLTGTIPTEVGGLKALRYLQIHNNDLSGTIPTELGGIPSLTYVWIDTNRFSGGIPDEICYANPDDEVFITACASTCSLSSCCYAPVSGC